MKFPIGMYRIHDKFIFDITVTIYDTLILYIYMISIYMMCFITELVLSVIITKFILRKRIIICAKYINI